MAGTWQRGLRDLGLRWRRPRGPGGTITDTSTAVVDQGTAPKRAGLVLAGLILTAAVANRNLGVANVALPTIGKAFDATQTQLHMIAVGYSLGSPAPVLCLGTVGDRYSAGWGTLASPRRGRGSSTRRRRTHAGRVVSSTPLTRHGRSPNRGR